MNPVFVRHLMTNRTAWSISSVHCSGVQLPTPPAPQKWPLKWVPISWPSGQALPMLSIVAWTASSPRKGIAEAPGARPGGRYRVRLSFGTM